MSNPVPPPINPAPGDGNGLDARPGFSGTVRRARGAMWRGREAFAERRGAMFAFALVVGIASGLAAFAFFWMTETAVHWFSEVHRAAPSAWSRAVLLLSPALGGLVTGYLLLWFAPDAKGGVAEVIDALLHRDGFIRTRVGAWKAVASAICIASGGSAGREGPVVQIGGSVGSTLAQVFGVTRQRAQLLVACGAAAGIASVFNAPIAGAFFAAEVVTGSFAMRDLSLLFTASAAGAVVARALLWHHAAFPTDLPVYQGGWTLLFHAVLGALAALGGNLFISVMHRVERFFRESAIREAWRPAVGGLAVGLIGVALNRTQVFGTGQEFMEHLFMGWTFADGSWLGVAGLLLLLSGAKVVATSFTLGSGGSGGDLMPSLFIGGALGGAYGAVVHHFFHTPLPPQAYALVGAVALFAGVAHAPITGIVLGIEMGWTYGMVLPLMVACSVSALVSSWIRTSSIYTLKLEERGIDVTAIRTRRATPGALDMVRVEDVMTRDFARIGPDVPLDALREQFQKTSHHGFVVIDGAGRLLGIITVSDLDRAADRGQATGFVRDLMVPAAEVITCFPTQTLRDALVRLGTREIGRIPVLDPTGTGRVVGVLRRSDILRGASQALSKAAPPRAESLTGGRLIGLDIAERHACAHAAVREMRLPEGVIFVSLRRWGEVSIPTGSTVLEPGDHVTAFIEPEAEGPFLEWLTQGEGMRDEG